MYISCSWNFTPNYLADTYARVRYKTVKRNVYRNVSKHKQTHRQRDQIYGYQRVKVAKRWKWPSDWTELNWKGKGEGGINESLGLAYTKSLWMVTTAMKLKDTCSLEGKLW